VREKPVVEIARDFQVTRQRVYQLSTCSIAFVIKISWKISGAHRKYQLSLG
jgi:hypothetical protein